jgi:hypothetical protein
VLHPALFVQRAVERRGHPVGILIHHLVLTVKKRLLQRQTRYLATDLDVTNEYVHLDNIESITNSVHSFTSPVVVCLRGNLVDGSVMMYAGKAQVFLSERGAVQFRNNGCDFF